MKEKMLNEAYNLIISYSLQTFLKAFKRAIVVTAVS